MLVIRRQIGQSILLKKENGEVIAKVMVCDLLKGVAKIGIQADKSVVIVREEMGEVPKREEKVGESK